MAEMDPFSLRPGQGISLEQTQNSLKIMEAKITLLEQRKNTLIEKGKRERALVRQMTMALAPKGWGSESPWQPVFGPHDPEYRRSMLDSWLEAHKSYDDAQVNLWEIDIAESKSAAQILKAAIESATDPAARLAKPGLM